jgi:hypothetical protein
MEEDELEVVRVEVAARRRMNWVARTTC